jgi:hypothetical protein
MLSGFIDSAHSYPAFTNKFITGTPVVRSFWSSRTKKKSSQYSNAYTGYGPNCLTHFPLYFHTGMDYIFIPNNYLQHVNLWSASPSRVVVCHVTRSSKLIRSWRLIFSFTKENILKAVPLFQSLYRDVHFYIFIYADYALA